MAGFPRERRVRRSAEIRAIVTEGRRFEGPSLNLHLALGPDPAAPARGTVVVPRFGRNAVDRNRLKRRVREIVRLHLLDAPELVGGAFVIRTRPSAYERRFEELRSELLGTLERIAARRDSQRP